LLILSIDLGPRARDPRRPSSARGCRSVVLAAHVASLLQQGSVSATRFRQPGGGVRRVCVHLRHGNEGRDTRRATAPASLADR
jgi:hypothetical protein